MAAQRTPKLRGVSIMMVREFAIKCGVVVNLGTSKNASVI